MPQPADPHVAVSHGRSFEDMLADPCEQFDLRSDLLARGMPQSAGTSAPGSYEHMAACISEGMCPVGHPLGPLPAGVRGERDIGGDCGSCNARWILSPPWRGWTWGRLDAE